MRMLRNFMLTIVLAHLIAAAAIAQNTRGSAELVVQTGHISSDIYSVTFSPNGRILASGGSDVKLWDVESGQELRTLIGHAGWVGSVAFSPDGKILASGGAYKILKLWDVASGKELFTLTGHEDSISSVAFSPDGRTLASGSWDNTIRIWDVGTGKQLRSLNGHSEPVASLAFSPDGSTLVSGSWDHTIRLWDPGSGRQLRLLEGHADKVLSVRFSPDGKLLATAGGNDTAFADGKTLGSGSLDNTIKLWDVASGHQLRSLRGHNLPVRSLVFSPDSKTLVSGSSDKAVRFWDVVSGEQTRLFDASDTAVLSLAFSPEGRILASGGDAIRLRDSVSGQELRAFKGHITSVFAVAFSPDGKTLAAGSEKGRVYLWDLAGGQQVRFLEGHNDFLIKVAFSPDGSTLASGGADKIIRLWDVKSGKERFKLAGHNESVNDLAFSSDGQTLVSSSGDKTIKLWNVLTGQLRESMQWSTENEERAHQLAPTFTRGSEQMKNDEATSGNFLARTSPAGVDVFDRTGRTELCDLIVVDENDWLVVTPKGFFDGSPRAWKQVIWRLNGNTFSVVPVEAFFSDFFHPGLLQDIFNGEVPTTEIAISNKDIRQPQLKLSLNDESSVEQSASSVNRSVAVKVEIADAPAGARDVRLFRNGSLVRVWHGDVLKGQSRAAIYATIPVVAGENLFTAYAFNHDNVKSPDASMTAIGAASLKRQGMIYILAVGINQYANSQYNLKYAVADAQEFAEEFKRQQMKLNNYAAVKVIPLSDKNATRAAIRKSLDDLSREALPEDAVIVYFAGHGTAQGKRFYLIPHDLGYAGPRTQLSQTGLQSILAHSISDEELEASFENFHGGQLVVLVIDACNSGQVLEAEEKRRGPMNSKGLAQLAYEKGMYVLTAAQSYQAANEAARLGHGFLTYALVEEGLKAGAADGEPKDGQVLLREWLDFATERVPQMQQEELDAQKKAGHRQLERIKFAEADSGAERSLQRPRVFYRRETEMHPLVVARP